MAFHVRVFDVLCVPLLYTPDLPKPMNYLCICQYGHSRSVGLKRLLDGLGQPAVAIGIATSGNALAQLLPWAHKVLLLDMAFLNSIPTNRDKDVVDMSIGPDVWQNPYSKEMRDKLRLRVIENWQRLGFTECPVFKE